MTSNEQSLLTEFVTSNRELEFLEKLVGEFNPFSILDIEHYEIRHSNMLSWLLDPNGSHGFDDIILKKFIIEVLKHNETSGFKYSISDFITRDLTAVSVFREYRVKKKRIDILIKCEDPELILVIENKIYASEGRGQLGTYYSEIHERYPGYELLPVYLTLYGDSPSHPSFASLGYERVLDAVRSAVDIYGNNISERKLDFIRYYIKALEVLVMDNPDVQKYCKVIYKKHKQAIDLILKYGVSNAFEAASGSFLEKHRDIIKKIEIGSYRLWFVPMEFLPFKTEMDNWASPYPVAYWFTKVHDEKLGLILEVGPITNREIRKRFLEDIKKRSNLRVPKNALLPEAKYTRIYSKYVEFQDWDDEELIVERMEELYLHDAKKVNATIVSLVKSFAW